MDVTKDNTSGVLKISGTLDIDTANQLRESLLDCFLRQPEVAVDLSQVDECDAAALQVLLAGRKESASACKAFRLIAVSPAITGTAEALGLSLDEPGDRRGKDHAGAN
jgi:anti-anti-sigma factor